MPFSKLKCFVGMCLALEDSFDEDLSNFMKIYGDADGDLEIKRANLPEFLDFLYHNRERISEDLKSFLDELHKFQTMSEKDPTDELVNGIPIQDESESWKILKEIGKEVAIQASEAALISVFSQLIQKAEEIV